MNLDIKRRNLSLSDDISPLIRFFKARKDLKDIYLNNKRQITLNNINNINHNLNNKKKQKNKKPEIKTYSRKLLKDQMFIISHFTRKIPSKEINYDYNFSLLNTFGNRNFFRKNNEMNINMFTKLSNNNNFFKTTAINYIKKRGNLNKKKIISYDKINLPKLNLIIKKKSKS